MYKTLPNPPPDLTLYLFPHRHTALFNALYASPHGGPIRMLPLVLESGTIHYELHVPCIALFNRLSQLTITTTSMTRAEWETLRTFIHEEGVLKVILSLDGGKTDFLGKLVVAGGSGEGEEGVEGVERESVSVRVWWQERRGEGAVLGARMRRGLEWVKARLGS
ncbi:hypothetical protein BU23DRAFT_231803 [Bimuria novae-zelandiae CBS 107.79]|uniref:Uncharacterized protein n=1 Tax=Bimuria novae-zelandiae CBS 107.79 TaxID=1447943 RepID=A0A6A5V4D8_9PLEO|nr:hypothetical protein BU23DRAFT_231803 [Bimuria novae-zelandiae CBS 107.79]